MKELQYLLLLAYSNLKVFLQYSAIIILKDLLQHSIVADSQIPLESIELD